MTGSEQVDETKVDTPSRVALPKWGALIRELRREQRISQRELSRIADVPRSTLRRIERGVTEGSMKTVERIAEALGYEIDLILKPIPGLNVKPPARG